ncbi:N-acetylmuramoyl-L-alanine amidase [Ornithinibacillus californiensis]|uniref:N-acetylmuramoyl-L-alanine amidase n=1 Tax=Ornithinibacillus californiensis TaxID=161536 RepID=UPI00064DCC7F|nr:N-acetylmuramoyl-L-alanine amidase [Ornithinibacillus californiensis]
MRYKKGIVIFLGLLLMVGIVPVQASTTEVIINEDNLNLRTGPGTNYERIGQVNAGERYLIKDQQGNWIQIQLDGYTAWVSSDYVSIQGEVSTGVEVNEQQTITITHDKTQIRNGPSTDYDIVHFAKAGEKITVIDKEGNWLKVKLNDGEGYVLKDLVEKKTESASQGLKGKKIVIDPGHGGNDSGAISAGEVLEKDITYKTAEVLAQELTMLGAEVLITRDQETFATLSSRATLSNVTRADAFISLHYNSVPNLPDATGISTYYYHEQYESLATFIQQEMIKESNDRDRGVGFGDFQVIRQNLMPAVLIELGFISNPEIDQLLATNAYQKKLVTGIVNGLQRYYATQK